MCVCDHAAHTPHVCLSVHYSAWAYERATTATVKGRGKLSASVAPTSQHPQNRTCCPVAGAKSSIHCPAAGAAPDPATQFRATGISASPPAAGSASSTRLRACTTACLAVMPASPAPPSSARDASAKKDAAAALMLAMAQASRLSPASLHQEPVCRGGECAISTSRYKIGSNRHTSQAHASARCRIGDPHLCGPSGTVSAISDTVPSQAPV